MKYWYLIVLLISFTFSCSAQKIPEIRKSSNADLVRTLNSAELLSKDTEEYLSVKVYRVDNGSGSAGFSDSHEVSHSLLIAVSTIDENPEQTLYVIGPFIKPEFLIWQVTQGYSKSFEIKYGPGQKNRTAIIVVDLKNASFKEKSQ